MKKIVLALIVSFLLVGCSKKTGCPTSGAAIGAEKVLSGDPKLAKEIRKSKYKGRKAAY